MTRMKLYYYDEDEITVTSTSDRAKQNQKKLDDVDRDVNDDVEIMCPRN